VAAHSVATRVVPSSIELVYDDNCWSSLVWSILKPSACRVQPSAHNGQCFPIDIPNA
jgi:hypothetical protein